MEYTTPIILGFDVITVSFACTKRFFYHIMMENSNLLLLGVQKEYISSTSTTNEPQKVEDEALNNENDTLDYEDGGYYRKNVDRKGGQLNKVDRNKKSGQKNQNDTQNDTQSDTQNAKNDTQG